MWPSGFSWFAALFLQVTQAVILQPASGVELERKIPAASSLNVAPTGRGGGRGWKSQRPPQVRSHVVAILIASPVRE